MNKRMAFRCKNIFTGKNSGLVDGYLVIEDDSILIVDSISKAKDYINKNTTIFDFHDNFLMPGINDYHIHLMGGAMMDRDGDLRLANSEEDAAELVWENCKDGNREWILASAWDHFRWPNQSLPNKKSLDRYFPDIPAFLLNKESHGAWVNSKLLEIFGIDKNTPDPPDGIIHRDENGLPSGYLHEAAMIPILETIYRSISGDEAKQSVKIFQRKANKYGITSVGDVSMFGISYEDCYRELEKQNELTMRIHYSKDIFDPIENLRKANKEFNGPMVCFNGVKAFIDGTPMGHTGYMIEPYADIPDFVSYPLIDKNNLFEIVTKLDKERIRIRIHACGDAGVRLCLDAFEHARQKNGDTKSRHCIEHIECINPKDIPRFGKLGVIPSIQPDHMPKYRFHRHPFHTMLGGERLKHCWPFGSLLKSFGLLAYGTDYPVAPLSPFRGIWRAVHRTTDEGKPKDGWNPTEKLTMNEILQSCTYGSAYAAGREHELGILAPGYLADFSILPDSLFDIIEDRSKFFLQEALLTVVAGKIVYSKG